jgi:hypothetical protein
MLAWLINLGFAASPSGAPPLVSVPNVVGETQAQATIDIQAAGLTVSVSTAYSALVVAGRVISQNPSAGSLVSPGSDVAIVVSLGPQPVVGSSSGGFLHEYERAHAVRIRKRREREEREAEAERLADETSREIAQLLHEQEAKDEERADLERLRELARVHRQEAATELTERVRRAYARVLLQENLSALEALDRELRRQLDEEEIAALMLLLNDE